MKENVPNHLGLIIDGNGRWAKKRGLPRSADHKAGYENLKHLSKYILDSGIKYLTVFAFSTENFNRDSKEVNYIMDIVALKFKEDVDIFMDNNVKVILSGRRAGLRDDVLEAMDFISEKTSENTGGVFNVCLNYGSRYEIVDMTRKIANLVVEGKLGIDKIDEKIISENMYQNLPDIDFIIRTSGEERLSNFMLWQSSYAEFYFPSVYFPDFDEKEFDKALEVYQKRERRFGGVKEV